MLRWTAAGAVSAPTTVQIRVNLAHAGLTRAGAPQPTRDLSTEELLANLLHFTVGMRTPRTRPCSTLVLSGQGVGARADLAPLLARARAEGVRRVVLHASPQEVGASAPDGWGRLVDQLVVPLQPGPDLQAVKGAVDAHRARGGQVATHTLLDADALGRLAEVVAVLDGPGDGPHTFTYPFPTGPRTIAETPPVTAAVEALRAALPTLRARGVAVAVKGLPACHLGPLAPTLRRTGNRWYVDADHQLDRALLFFPDVVAFHKAEVCRFCAASDACDGFFRAWLDRPGCPPLAPLSAGEV